MKPAINIQNYEEFFLLYADGELSVAEQLAVEQFVQAHPQLAGELELLQQLRLPQEELRFDAKELLFRNAEQAITLENYETHFLLYVDNELDAAQRRDVELFVLQHPALQDQFLLLKQTQLPVETMVFADKSSLYRKEDKKRPVFYMSWQRAAVAAALMGLAVLAWMLVPSNNKIKDQAIAQLPAVKQPPVAAAAMPAQGNETASGPVASTEQKNRIQQSPVQVKETGGQAVPVDNAPAAEPVHDLTARVNLDAEPVSSQLANRNAEAGNVSGRAGIKAPVEHTDLVAVSKKEDEHPAVTVQPAVYKELDTEDDKKSLYVGSLEINKDKLRGFFRKATSLFRGKAKQQEDDKTEATPSNTRTLR